MKRAKQPTFVVTLPVSVSDESDRQLTARLLAGTRLYNAALGEALRRLDLMRQSKAWQQARNTRGKDRPAAFRAVINQFGFKSDVISAFATSSKNAAGWQNRLSANETQTIAETAFGAAEQYSFGKRGRPRFKNRTRPIKSFSGKKNSTGIRYRSEFGVVEWAGLTLPIQFPPTGKDPWLEQALQHETKFCRLLWRNIKGRRRWYVQLAQKGETPIKASNTMADGRQVGLDVGPSSVAVVSETGSDLVAFCPTIKHPWQQARRLQRAMDRSRRATNPHCFNADGTWRKGARITSVSKRYQKLRQQYAEAERKLSSERKRAQGELANSILRLGNVVKSEKLSYRAWQKQYGKSVKVKAPATFINNLKRKAERAGGEFVDLNTRPLKMSQYDHVSGQCTKKPLSQRWHLLDRQPEGEVCLIQRDLYSAFLALCAEENEHQSRQLQQHWPVVKELLEQVGWCRTLQVASGETPVLPTVRPSERLAC